MPPRSYLHLSLSSKVAKVIFDTENHGRQDFSETPNFLKGKRRCLQLFPNPLKGKGSVDINTIQHGSCCAHVLD